MRNWGTEVKQLAQGRTANTCWTRDWNPAVQFYRLSSILFLKWSEDLLDKIVFQNLRILEQKQN